jgi:hypothetical protein
MVVLLCRQPGVVVVHANTFVPVVKPVNVELPNVGVVMVPPGPDTSDQVPSPNVGIFPVRVVEGVDTQMD